MPLANLLVFRIAKSALIITGAGCACAAFLITLTMLFKIPVHLTNWGFFDYSGGIPVEATANTHLVDTSLHLVISRSDGNGREILKRRFKNDPPNLVFKEPVEP